MVQMVDGGGEIGNAEVERKKLVLREPFANPINMQMTHYLHPPAPLSGIFRTYVAIIGQMLLPQS